MNQSNSHHGEGEGEGEYIFVSVSGSVTVSAEGPDEDGPAGVREPLAPRSDPPSLAAEAEVPNLQ